MDKRLAPLEYECYNLHGTCLVHPPLDDKLNFLNPYPPL